MLSGQRFLFYNQIMHIPFLVDSSTAAGDVASSNTGSSPSPTDPGFWQDLGNQIVKFFTVDGPALLFRIIFAIIILIVGIYLIKLISHLLKKSLSKTRRIGTKNNKKERKIDTSVVSFLVTSVRFFLAILLAFLVIYILGLPLTGFASIVSSAFLAIGLGLQDVITNFANGIIILSENNINTGDYIVVDGVEGTVTRISMMRTTLETVDGRKVLIPNTKLSADIVTNNTSVKFRRQQLFFTFRSGIDIDKMCALLEETANSVKGVVPEVGDGRKTFTAIEDFSQTRQNCIKIKVVFYMKNADYWDVFSESQKVFYKRFAELGIQLAGYDSEYYVPGR